MTAQGNSQPYVEKMVARILSETHDKEAAKIAAWKKPTDDLRRLVRHDYVRSLRRNLPYREIRTLVEAYSELLPGFNKEIVGMLPTDRLADWATALDLHFNAAPNEGDDGLALRGFYVTRQEGMLKRPLIYVNTAHHPLAVSSTFCQLLISRSLAGLRVGTGISASSSVPERLATKVKCSGCLSAMIMAPKPPRDTPMMALWAASAEAIG